MTRPVRGDSITKEQRAVRVMSYNFTHNHPLNKGMLIKAKKVTNKYPLSVATTWNIFEMIDLGPIPTRTIRNYL